MGGAGTCFKIKIVMSCEPGRKAPYSQDLRYKMVWQRLAMELPFRTIAKNLNVSVGTVHNILKLFKRSGCVEPKIADLASTRVLSQDVELVVISFIMENPCSYLSEICKV